MKKAVLTILALSLITAVYGQSPHYALYSDKIKSITDTSITPTSENFISINSWLLAGNAGTTRSNFLGTTDNKPLNLRTNNLQRFSISESTIAGKYSISFLSAGQRSDFAKNPIQFSIWGRDIAGYTIPFNVSNNVTGMTWGTGLANTLGRLVRLAQFYNSSGPDFQFYDMGIDQAGDYFIGDNQLWSEGNIAPRKMLTISPSNYVGINFGWGEHPSANFHTRGSLRFEGINSNNSFTRILVIDAKGNVASRDASTLESKFWTPDASGVYANNAAGHVGIGGMSASTQPLTVYKMENTVDGTPTSRFVSNDSWQTNMRLDNATSDRAFSIVVGGKGNAFPNYGVGARNFGIVNGRISTTYNTIPFIITSDDKVGISSRIGGSDNLPRSRLHVRDGDVYIDQIGSGVIMKSPNGQCWRMTVSNAGTPVFTAITCP